MNQNCAKPNWETRTRIGFLGDNTIVTCFFVTGFAFAAQVMTCKHSCYMFSVTSFTFVAQVMTCRPRSDIFINLPALRKLDNMLLVRFNLAFLNILVQKAFLKLIAIVNL